MALHFGFTGRGQQLGSLWDSSLAMQLLAPPWKREEILLRPAKRRMRLTLQHVSRSLAVDSSLGGKIRLLTPYALRCPHHCFFVPVMVVHKSWRFISSCNLSLLLTCTEVCRTIHTRTLAVVVMLWAK
jgi:hypothetical protein